MTEAGVHQRLDHADRDDAGRTAGRPDQPTRVLLGIAAAALAIRLWYALFVVRHRVLGYDALWYTTMAGNLADGRGFQVTFPLIPWHIYQATAKYGPAWPATLSVLAWLGPRSVTAFRMVSCVLGAGSVFLIGRLAASLLDRRVGVVAAAIAAVYPTLVAADGSLMTETLYLVLVLVLLNALATGPGGLSYRRTAGLGVLIGAAALTRGEGVFLLPAILAPWLLVHRLGLRRTLAMLAVAGLAAVAVMAPWVLRNATTFHKLVIADDQALVIGGANCDPSYYGKVFGGWDAYCFGEYRTGFENLTEAQRAAIYQHEGLDYVATHRRRAVLVAGMRVARTWGVVTGGQLTWEANETRPLGALQAAWVVYLALLPLAAIGAVRLARDRRLSVLLVAPVVLVTVIAFFTYGTQRARYTAEPTLIILAACTVSGRSTSSEVRHRRGA